MIQKIIVRCFHTGRNLEVIEHPCEECVKTINKSINNNRIKLFQA